jgi:PIN domain nuclease of toxin-antitoxin system
MTAYVDTHVLVWIGRGETDKISAAAQRALDDYDLLVSPAAVLEFEFLHEIGRLRASAEKMIALLESEIAIRVCDLPFRDVVNQTLKERWTRDPFDRLIVANAKAAGAPLVTKDERIRKHYPRAIW